MMLFLERSGILSLLEMKNAGYWFDKYELDLDF